MHTDTSLQEFRQLTTVLGEHLRYFADETCQHFRTFETDNEYQARNRAAARRLAKSTPSLSVAANNTEPAIGPLSAGPVIPDPQMQASLKVSQPPAPFAKSGKQPKTFNISTPKAHFFADYADQIELHGPTDSLSTKLVRFFGYI
jgi:hypothetical protein